MQMFATYECHISCLFAISEILRSPLHLRCNLFIVWSIPKRTYIRILIKIHTRSSRETVRININFYLYRISNSIKVDTIVFECWYQYTVSAIFHFILKCAKSHCHSIDTFFNISIA